MVVTRFPPSPTGYLHIGGARTALYSWLHARQQGGKFVLRIEDTDRERSTEESVQAIFDGMQWLGLDYDEGPFYQTRRLERYQEVIQQLLDSGHAYYCCCSKEELDEMREAQRRAGEKPRYNGFSRDLNIGPEGIDGVKPVVRFRNPLDGVVVIDDLVKGRITISNSELDDLVIARADGMPTYNLTVVVDDWDMGMTHVIRGDDHINNTPRQINIFRALGAELPKFAHVPMILGEDGSRLSKRHGAVSVMQYRDEGYLPHALLNYLVRLGWSHGDQEIFAMDELLALFKIENVSTSASTFNPQKLQWLNQEYIKSMEPSALIEASRWYFEQRNRQLPDDDYGVKAIAQIQERCQTLWDVVDQSHYFFADPSEYDEKALNKFVNEVGQTALKSMLERLQSEQNWTQEVIHEHISAVVSELELGFAKVAQPLRIAATGGTNSPSIDGILALLGKDTSLRRINKLLSAYDAS